MRLTADEVRKIASLAGLRLSPEEERDLVPQLAEIVRFVEEMGEATGERGGEEGSWGDEGCVREMEDVPAEGLPRETVLANAPEHGDGFVRVPPVLTPSDPVDPSRRGGGP